VKTLIRTQFKSWFAVSSSGSFLIRKPKLSYMAEIYLKTTFMKKVLAFIAVVVFLSACSRSVTPFEAANKNYKRCHSIR
jgi:hypothetical protein